MKNYIEKQNKLSKETRRKLLDSLATSEYGQAIREELVDLIEGVSNVLTISTEMINGENKRLAIEILSRGRAAAQLESLYKILVPRKVEKIGFKTKR